MNRWTCKEDKESRDIAHQLIFKYPHFFASDINLKKIYFMRTEEYEPKSWIARVKTIGHPWSGLPSMEDYIYLLEVIDTKYTELSMAQRSLLIFHELLHIAEGGCDFESKNCGKLRDHEIQDFPEIIAASGGHLYWNRPGETGIPDLLSEEGVEIDLEEALKKSGYLKEDKVKAKEDALDEIAEEKTPWEE